MAVDDICVYVSRIFCYSKRVGHGGAFCAHVFHNDAALRFYPETQIAKYCVAVIGGVGGYFLTDHIRVRVSTWLDPWADATNKGFQITQSLIAIASGGFFGAGLGNGDPYLIPEVHSDFIFSAICEEMGLFMGIAIIMLYFIFS